VTISAAFVKPRIESYFLSFLVLKVIQETETAMVSICSFEITMEATTLLLRKLV